MADAQKIAIRPRAVTGKKVKRLRREGVLPGVVFGGHKDSTPVETDLREFERGYRRWGTTTLLTLEGLPEGEVSALIHDVSRSTLTGALLHVDFHRVSLTEKVRAQVPLRFVGESAAVRGGGVLVHAVSEVNVEAFPQDIPHAIDVDLEKLVEIDDSLYVRDLVVDGTKVELTDDPEGLVVRVVPVRVEEEAAPAPAAAPEGVEAPAEAAAEGEEAAETGAPKPGAAPAAAKPGAPAAPAKAEPKKG